jgi:phosphatidylglycerophosphatase A
MTRLAVWIATAGGLGYAPVAPGTFGSAGGLVIYWFTRHWDPRVQLMLALAVIAVGTWAAERAAAHFGKDDPGPVVIDEVAGQLVTLAFTGAGATGAVVAFLLFRVLDIIKPYPANRFEALHGGVGIMADDVMAGVYGCLLMHLAARVVPGFVG